MCRFFGVSGSSYHDYIKRLGQAHKDAALAEKLRVQQAHCFQTYGYRRMWLWLKSQNICRIPRVLYTNGNPERIEELPGWHMEWKRIRNTNWWRQFHGKEITKEALVSIIIPSKDNVQVLLRLSLIHI